VGPSQEQIYYKQEPGKQCIRVTLVKPDMRIIQENLWNLTVQINKENRYEPDISIISGKLVNPYS